MKTTMVAMRDGRLALSLLIYTFPLVCLGQAACHNERKGITPQNRA